MSARNPESYGSYCGGCGHLVAVAVNNPNRSAVYEGSMRQWKREQWADGCRIKGKTSQELRDEMASWGCRCPAPVAPRRRT